MNNPNYKPRYPKTKVYSIFNKTDYTNDLMLQLLTTQLALKASIRASNSDAKQLIFN